MMTKLTKLSFTFFLFPPGDATYYGTYSYYLELIQVATISVPNGNGPSYVTTVPVTGDH